MFDSEGENENFSIEVAMDTMFSQRDIEEIFIRRFRKYQFVKVRATLLNSVHIEKGLSEQNFFAKTHLG